jgi:hypothetical protein
MDWQAVIISGKCIDELPSFVVHRRQEQFVSAPREWCLIDTDELLNPGEFGSLNNYLPELVEVSIQKIPPPGFQSVDF